MITRYSLDYKYCTLEQDGDGDLVDFGDHLSVVSEMQSRLESLESALRKANAQAEHFEREWYLRGDVIESLEKDAARLDWMIDEQVFMEYERDNYWLVFPDGSEQKQSRPSTRVAIDTAMQSANKGE